LDRSHGLRSSLYTSPAKPEKTVISAGIAEIQAMDGNLPLTQVFNASDLPARSFTSLWTGFRQSLPE